jgi:hypothetical protein
MLRTRPLQIDVDYMQNWFLENDMKLSLTKMMISSITHETNSINFSYNVYNNPVSLHQ